MSTTEKRSLPFLCVFGTNIGLASQEAPHCSMALVHDDDLALLDLDALGDETVGGCLYFRPIVSMS